jgi:hypothetical protein
MPQSASRPGRLKLTREKQALATPLLKRMVSALSELVAEAPLAVLQRAAEAPSGAGSAASLVAHLSVASPRLAAADPEAAAVARAAEFKQSVLDSMPTFSTAEVATLLGISAEAVRKRRAAGKLLAVPQASDWRFPAWQFPSPSSSSRHGTIPGLERLLAALPMQNPWAQLDLLTAPLDGYGASSIVGLLEAGAADEAVAIVAAYGDHGA